MCEKVKISWKYNMKYLFGTEKMSLTTVKNG